MYIKLWNRTGTLRISLIIMATGFSVDENKCEGLGCQASSGVTYILKEKMNYCKECAPKTGCCRKVRKDELGLLCEIHDKPVKLYCQEHELAVCRLCAIKDHQKPCQLENVPVVLEQKRDQLLKLRPTLNDKQHSWKTYESRVSECMKKCEAHIKSVEKAVNDTKDGQLARWRKEEQDAAKLIDDEADEEIRKITEEINEKREARLKRYHEYAEKHQQKIENKRHELLDDVTSRVDTAEEKMLGLQRNARDVVKAIDKAAGRMDILLEDDKELLKGAHELITSLNYTLGKTADEDVVENITRTIQCVRLIQGTENEMYEESIVGYAEEYNPFERYVTHYTRESTEFSCILSQFVQKKFFQKN